ncbi:MAG: hypothetical protein AAF191_09615 [Verrucomicrobiota bacterium]
MGESDFLICPDGGAVSLETPFEFQISPQSRGGHELEGRVLGGSEGEQVYFRIVSTPGFCGDGASGLESDDLMKVDLRVAHEQAVNRLESIGGGGSPSWDPRYEGWISFRGKRTLLSSGRFQVPSGEVLFAQHICFRLADSFYTFSYFGQNEQPKGWAAERIEQLSDPVDDPQLNRMVHWRYAQEVRESVVRSLQDVIQLQEGFSVLPGTGTLRFVVRKDGSVRGASLVKGHTFDSQMEGMILQGLQESAIDLPPAALNRAEVALELKLKME